MLKKIIKILFTCLFIALAIFMVLFSLNKLDIISLDFSFLHGIPGWEKIANLESEHMIPFNSLVFGMSILLAYIALNIILSMIPILGKITKIVVKFVIGWLLIFASVVLIIFGTVGVLWLIPGL